jgi:hypothetical protein
MRSMPIRPGNTNGLSVRVRPTRFLTVQTGLVLIKYDRQLGDR